MVIIPNKLQKNDHINVVAVSRSLDIISLETRHHAEETLKKIWINVAYWKNANIKDSLEKSNDIMDKRAEDLNNAFIDQSIKGILSVIWGFSAIKLVDKLNYEIIKKNPKIFCWYSDVTVVLNAIHAKTGLVTYYWPHYSTFWAKLGNEYTVNFFKKITQSNVAFRYYPSSYWSEDKRFINQFDRKFKPNKGLHILQEWNIEGRTIGWNINALRLLNWTGYLPNLKNKILFLENDGLDKEITAQEFDRRLDSLLLQPWWAEIKGLMIGRFKSISNMNLEILSQIIINKPILKGKPIIYGFDFWHTLPMMTIPIGWKLKLIAHKKHVSLTFLEF